MASPLTPTSDLGFQSSADVVLYSFRLIVQTRPFRLAVGDVDAAGRVEDVAATIKGKEILINVFIKGERKIREGHIWGV